MDWINCWAMDFLTFKVVFVVFKDDCILKLECIVFIFGFKLFLKGRHFQLNSKTSNAFQLNTLNFLSILDRWVDGWMDE